MLAGMNIADWVLETPSWALLAGVIVPLLTALVNQPGWSKPIRQAVALGVALVLGVLGCLADGTLTEGMTVLQVVAVVVAASEVAYRTVLSELAPAAETASSPRQAG
jgi:peptidoglycan/LPS O-acetylase OafA/YrhL